MVIVIDDNTISKFFVKQEIEKSSYISKVISFDSTLEALFFLKPLIAVLDKPIYIFIKIDMPLLNGYEFIEKCKQISNLHNYANIILMTKTELDTEEEIKINQYTNVTYIDSYFLNKSYIEGLFLNTTSRYLQSKAS